MTGARTVTVHTIDHGPVTLPEPAWCLSEHPGDGHRVDISHEGPEAELALPTWAGPRTLMHAVFEQRPFTERRPGRGPFVNVEIGGDWYPADPAGLDQMAAALVEHACTLRALARQLAVLDRDAR